MTEKEAEELILAALRAKKFDKDGAILVMREWGGKKMIVDVGRAISQVVYHYQADTWFGVAKKMDLV